VGAVVGVFAGLVFGMAVAALAFMSCVGDALCSSDEGATYGKGALIVLPLAGLATGVAVGWAFHGWSLRRNRTLPRLSSDS
jgi:hypothetical protein